MSLEVETETPTSYTWETPDKPITIRLDFDVIDQILAEVMQGFGAVPRRGAEVGGLLLGKITRGERIVVHITDFEPVACEHARGPSYLLSDADQERLSAALERWGAGSEGERVCVVGFYRSHTREGMALSPEDLTLYNRCFPLPEQVFLLVKPFATKVSMGAFFFREGDTVRSESSYQEFPFRRRELGGSSLALDRLEPPEPPAPIEPAPAPTPQSSPMFEIQPVAPPPKRNVWIPLSFIFLLVGIALGFQAAISLRPAGSAAPARDPLALSLRASKSGSSIQLDWDRRAPAIQNARGATLQIADGAYSKSVDIDAGQLLNGTVIYRYLTSRVTFRLEVFSRDRGSVAEALEFHTGGVPASASDAPSPSAGKAQ